MDEIDPNEVFPIISSIATGHLPYRTEQMGALNCVLNSPAYTEDKLHKTMPRETLLTRMYQNTQIKSRFLGIPDFIYPQEEKNKSNLFFWEDGDFSNKTLQERLVKFKELGVPLAVEVARNALNRAGVDPKSVRKITLVSSTGFHGPGIDCSVIKELGLPQDIDRCSVGFMGCAAAINGFRVTSDFCRSHPGEPALLICIDISSVHATLKGDFNAIIHSIFGDGCAAAVLVGQRAKDVEPGSFGIFGNHSMLVPGTEDGISLYMNHNGISCNLSKNLSSYLRGGMKAYIHDLMEKGGIKNVSDIDLWAVHPGGTRILEAVEAAVGLTRDQTKTSWKILETFGNMLGPTVMFVLEELLMKDQEQMKHMYERGADNCLAFSFSPGIGIEGLFLKKFR